MPDQPAHEVRAREREDPSLARLGAFSDGVFAFAITLLILAIRIPHPGDADSGHGLLSILLGQWRSYLAYVLSFMLVGINWANHRVMFSAFARGTHVLTWLNLVYLMLAVAFVPIPTAVLGAWLGSSNGNDEVVATVFYGVCVTVGAVTYMILWWYGAYLAHLTTGVLTDMERRAHTLAWAPSPFVLIVLTLIAFVSPAVAVVGFVAIVLLYVLPVPRLLALAKSRRARRTAR